VEDGHDDLLAVLSASAGAWDLSVSEEVGSRIVRHFLLVRETNRRINLTGLRHEVLRVAFIRLVVDALSAALAVGPEGVACDLGSGAGYPGVPLALLHPAQFWTLVEATRKKATEIERMCDLIDARNVAVVPERAEVWGRTVRTPFQWVTARAVGALPLVAELGAPLLSLGGTLVAMRGPSGRDEVRAAQKTLTLLGLRCSGIRELALPEGQGARTLVQLTKTAPTPAQFPRSGALLGRF
jgi:16S rRNA (guanine527-N7)-methyltransferase